MAAAHPHAQDAHHRWMFQAEQGVVHGGEALAPGGIGGKLGTQRLDDQLATGARIRCFLHDAAGTRPDECPHFNLPCAVARSPIAAAAPGLVGRTQGRFAHQNILSSAGAPRRKYVPPLGSRCQYRPRGRKVSPVFPMNLHIETRWSNRPC